jgi:hypothetical protein
MMNETQPTEEEEEEGGFIFLYFLFSFSKFTTIYPGRARQRPAGIWSPRYGAAGAFL